MSVDPIIVGTDGSHTATRAVRKAGDLAHRLGTTVHVVNSYIPSGRHTSADVVTGGDQQRNAAQKIVESAREHLAELGVESRCHVEQGGAAEALMATADAEGAMMIVVGNRGMTGPRSVLGSVPNTISHKARCPVLIVPTGDDAYPDG